MEELKPANFKKLIFNSTNTVFNSNEFLMLSKYAVHFASFVCALVFVMINSLFQTSTCSLISDIFKICGFVNSWLVLYNMIYNFKGYKKLLTFCVEKVIYFVFLMLFSSVIVVNYELDMDIYLVFRSIKIGAMVYNFRNFRFYLSQFFNMENEITQAKTNTKPEKKERKNSRQLVLSNINKPKPKKKNQTKKLKFEDLFDEDNEMFDDYGMLMGMDDCYFG